MRWSSLVVAALLLGQGPPPSVPATAKPPRDYVRFELFGNPEQMLADFLKTSREDGFQKLLMEELKKLQENPEALGKLLDQQGGPTSLAQDPIIKELVAKVQAQS